MYDLVVELDALALDLPPYGTGIYTVSTTRDTVRINDPVTGLDDQAPQPSTYVLEQNYPNPFNPTTTIRFSLPEAGTVNLSVFDMLGRMVRVIARENLAAGDYHLQWDGRNEAGVPVGSGVYLYRLAYAAGGSSIAVRVRKMVLLR